MAEEDSEDNETRRENSTEEQALKASLVDRIDTFLLDVAHAGFDDQERNNLAN